MGDGVEPASEQQVGRRRRQLDAERRGHRVALDLGLRVLERPRRVLDRRLRHAPALDGEQRHPVGEERLEAVRGGRADRSRRPKADPELGRRGMRARARLADPVAIGRRGDARVVVRDAEPEPGGGRARPVRAVEREEPDPAACHRAP